MITLPTYLVASILAISTLAEPGPSHHPPSPQPTSALEESITLWDAQVSAAQQLVNNPVKAECPVPPELQSDISDLDADFSSVPTSAVDANYTDPPAEQESSSRNETLIVEDFVSFEDWRKSHVEAEQLGVSHVSEAVSSGSSSQVPAAEATNTATPDRTYTQPTLLSQPARSAAVPPIHNKYNYASPDCSARIHSSSPQTQHASSLLHKSRDRYMLTPCKANEHWVVIELCDEIRVEAVEVAIWEFFSGVVRDVRVSVGGEEDEEEGGNSTRWSEVGYFVGKNVRGVQTFTLSQATSFHRFIRLDFPSYYGTEYYCPVSLVKVFGMNQMESFKWEQRVIAANAKEREKDRSVVRDKEAEENRVKEQTRETIKLAERRAEEERRERELKELEQLVEQQASRLGQDLPDFLAEAISSTSEVTTETLSNLPTSVAENFTTWPAPTHVRAPPKSDSSESIYAFIIRRLNDLEGNSSLVARYIEEQNRVTRLMIGRAEKSWDEWRKERENEDRGRWEQDRMRQEDRFGKILSQMEQQRVATEHDRRETQSQMRILADELGHERRRGLAQLIIMFVFVVISVASRSSTIDTALKPLLAEAKRRRSIYNRKSSPLDGLHIDTAVSIVDNDEPFRTKSATKLTKRPNTPSFHHRRQASLAIPNYRSTSDQHTAQAGLLSPRPRASLPPRPSSSAPPRRLAKSAHLHTLEADRVRSKMRAEAAVGEGGTPQPGPTVMANMGGDSAAAEPESLALESSGDEQSDWGTDAEGKVVSVEGVERELRVEHPELIEELARIWDEKM